MIDQIIGHYRVIQKLDQGGMSAVYLAEDTRLSRKAVLKFLLQEYALDAELKTRFEREARVAAVLQHPNIVTIYEVGEYEGASFIVMEYVEGESLRSLLMQTELLPESASEIAVQICDGLSQVHRAGITHRDLKPGNILFDNSGRAKITDFGIARLPGVPRLTRPGAIMGTPEYMSPEQAQGQELDARSDIFSLGIMLYEMLTRQRPFTGKNYDAIIESVVSQTPSALAAHRRDLSPGWQQIIDNALAKNPKHRYQCIEDFRADIQQESRWSPRSHGEKRQDFQSIGKYRIEKELGRGGMGFVYKAWDTVLERTVALKMIHPALAQDNVFLTRFKGEAKALAKLDSRYIVNVYDLLETQTDLFIVMQYVEGSNLATIIQKSKALAPARACRLLKQTLSGIGHAHQAGVFHRDLKPSNIMLTPQGLVKVMDFGLAKVSQNPKLSSACGTGGTLFYMSPEQLEGLNNVDHRSDIYSLGMTFYELLAGRLPFEEKGSDYAIRKTIVEKDFPPPHQFNPALPPALSQIILKAIRKKPAARFQSAGEMIQAIEKFERSTQSPARQRQSVARFAIPALIATFLLCVLIYFRFYRQPVPPAATVSIVTQPPSATVYLNGKSIGATPVNALPLQAGAFKLSLRKTNYVNHDTTITVKAGQATPLVFFLQPVKKISPAIPASLTAERSELGGLYVASQPPGATIFINNKIVGRTPATVSREAGRYSIMLRKTDYQDYLTTAAVTRGRTAEVEAKLVPLAGTLIILVTPTGSIYIDGNLYKPDTDVRSNFKLSAGMHWVQVRNANYGVWEKAVKIQPNKESEFIINFNKQFTVPVVAVQPDWGEIYVDNQRRGDTPMELRLRPGRHVIEVRREGYAPERRILNVENNLVEPLRFNLKPRL
jgi:serine/threonine protein kinase